MIIVNMAELKNNLSKYLALVEKGAEIKICKSNLPIAHIIPTQTKEQKNNTRLGCGKGSATILGDLTESFIPAKHWEMLNK